MIVALKGIVFAFLAMFSMGALASVNCMGIPEVVKLGDIGPDDGFLMVNVAGKEYRLGTPENEAAKVRLTLVLAALAANKSVMLRFYDPYNDCAAASSARALPTSVQLLK